MNDFTQYPLGALLTAQNETIRRNAMSILKELQRNPAMLADIDHTPTPKTWSRKGRCPACNVGTGSKHRADCMHVYKAQKGHNK